MCAGCGTALPAAASSVAYAGFQSIDLVWGDAERPGLYLHITDHRLHDGLCDCGHRTRARPGEGLVEDARLGEVALSVTVQRPCIGAGSGAAARPARRSAMTPAR